jgi:hypothetical protein
MAMGKHFEVMANKVSSSQKERSGGGGGGGGGQ